jgi:Na+/proline symporter
MFGINNRLNTKRYFFYGLLAGILLDTIWIIILNRDQNQSSTFRVIVFGLTIFSLVIKIILSYLIKNRRR